MFGFMGSGKTTYGKKLAELLDMEFIDLDHYIESREERTIKHIFNSDGEEAFRKIEREALLETLEKDDFVMATGGGTPCFYDNIKKMNRQGLTVYLKLDVRTLVSRLINAKINRPLIWGKSEEELTRYIRKTLHKRNKYYRKAKFVVNAKNLTGKELYKVLSRRLRRKRWMRLSFLRAAF